MQRKFIRKLMKMITLVGRNDRLEMSLNRNPITEDNARTFVDIDVNSGGYVDVTCETDFDDLDESDFSDVDELDDTSINKTNPNRRGKKLNEYDSKNFSTSFLLFTLC